MLRRVFPSLLEYYLHCFCYFVRLFDVQTVPFYGRGSSVMSSDRSVPTTTLLVCDGNSTIATAYTAVSHIAPPRALSALNSTQMTANDRSPSIMSHSLKRKNGVHVDGLRKATFQLGPWPCKLHWRPSSKAFMGDFLWVRTCGSLQLRCLILGPYISVHT